MTKLAMSLGPSVSVMVVLIALNWSPQVRSQALPFPEDRPFSYSAVVVTESADPHAYGASVEFCKLAGMWAGFISDYTGFVADPPIGKLENIQLDEGAGMISFTADLIVGVTSQGTGRVPAIRRYRFSGRIDEDTIRGVLLREPGDGQPGASTSEEIILRRESRNTSFAESCDQWNQTRTQVMDLRNGIYL